MHTVWTQRREEILSDCIVPSDVFHQMVDRLAEFVVPYQHVLETKTGQRNVHRYLQGLLSHLPGKNAEDIATFVDVERQVIQDFIGTMPWDHRPLVTVLVGQVAERLGEPDGIMAFDPSSFPQARHAFGRGAAPMVWPPREGRQLPGGGLHGIRLSSRACLARLPLVPL
jgi:DDE superfamily endonuclease